MASVLVTGGGGFLGSFVVELLSERREELGVARVVVLDVLDSVRAMDREEDAQFKSKHVGKWVVGSINDPAALGEALKDVDAVVHVASVVDIGTADHALMRKVNVEGTQALLEMAKATKRVRAFVYASSVDVLLANVFHDIDGLDEESCPYAADVAPLLHVSKDVYSMTKTAAEKAVLASNQTGFLTGVVRPVGLFGPRDHVHLMAVLKAAMAAGRMNFFKIGTGEKVFQHVYVENCAWMHCLCLAKLLKGDANVAGQAFMGIDNTKVTNFFEFFDYYLALMGYRVPTIPVPTPLAWTLASIAEDVFYVLRWIAPSAMRNKELLLTRRAVQGTCVTQWFNTTKAQRLLGYQPLVGPKEAQARSLAYLRRRFPLGPYPLHTEAESNFPPARDDDDFRPSDAKYKSDVLLSECRNNWRAWFLLAASAALAASARV